MDRPKRKTLITLLGACAALLLLLALWLLWPPRYFKIERPTTFWLDSARRSVLYELPAGCEVEVLGLKRVPDPDGRATATLAEVRTRERGEVGWIDTLVSLHDGDEVFLRNKYKPWTVRNP